MPENNEHLIRDMELVRRLLLFIAENGKTGKPVDQPEYEDYSKPMVWYHLDIMHQQKLFKGYNFSNIYYIVETLTWDGQDFLLASKDDNVWNQAKTKAGNLFNTLSLDLLNALLKQVAKERIGIEI